MRQAVWLFLVSIGTRLLTAPPWLSGWYAAAYQGDAPRWRQLALPDAAVSGDPETLLPFRPPAMTWIVRLLGDGASADPWRTKTLLLVLGAAIAPLLYLQLRRSFAERTARLAGWICAFAHGLVVLGSGVHSEIPYLFLFVLSGFDWDRMRTGGGAWPAARWGMVQATACLLRADHALVLALQLGWLLATRAPRALRSTTAAGLAAAAVLAPWQWHAAQQIAAFQHGPGLAQAPPPLPWDADALAAARAWPSFAQAGNAGFLGATVQARGGQRVTAADLSILAEAYACAPAPLATPFVALYGPLNFFLGNARESDGGFTQAPLDRPPPLRGGPQRYPPGLLQQLPRDGQLALAYPPHLQAVTHGYALGFAELTADPFAGALRLLRKLRYGWQGAATGIGAHALPIGTEGPRRPVDLTTPESVLAAAWRVVLLALAAAGALRLRREPAAAAWLLWVLAKLVTLAAFFGYARLGALMIPALALCWAHAITALTSRVPNGWQRRLGWSALALAILLELLHAARSSPPLVDGLPFAPSPAPRHAAAVVRY